MYTGLTPLLLVLAAGAALVLISLIKSGHFIKYLLLSSVSGIGSLFAVNLLSAITGVTIALNYITLSVSSLFGISGVIGLLMMF